MSEKILNGHKGPIYRAEFSYDSQFFVTGGYDGIALVWSIFNQTLLRKFELMFGMVISLCCSPLEHYFAIGSDKGLVQILSPKKIKPIR